MNGVTIRNVRISDAQNLLEIYAHYVKNTAITFEYDVPSVSEFESRIKRITAKYPYLVAEKDGRIVGFAYAGIFKDRAAYDRSVEVTIYLDASAQGQGIGRALYQQLYACIGIPSDKADEYLDFNSMQFHEHLGYTLAGTFRKCGCKFGRWYDMVWLEKIIGEHN